ncbi:MAG: histone methyltransferase set2 [Thelocarpon impressellum]|nr:MAG: histone methyltransferase set2 [Thelocarpon impressellum]
MAALQDHPKLGSIEVLPSLHNVNHNAELTFDHELLDSIHVGQIRSESSIPPTRSPSPPAQQTPAQQSQGTPWSPSASQRAQSPMSERDDYEETSDGDITMRTAKAKGPKFLPKPSKPVVLYDHLPDATAAATDSFEVIVDSIYGSKSLGSTKDSLGCDCVGQWVAGQNVSCGDEDCVNRATKIECTDVECSSCADCQNQRFQKKQYAKVSVIQTKKKGYGLRADVDLKPHDFIFEYIGDVIDENNFRRRQQKYADEGIKHFYFMSLEKQVFIDATKRGNLGRFCNHSCSPNCFVDKWVVGDKQRMGIFAQREIKAGEELAFNYNVDRYGADPQECYCGESNCSGYLGGKTQTDCGTKLSLQIQVALGVEDGVAKKGRSKKKGDETDEDYVDRMQRKALDDSHVNNAMATLLQCKERWIIVRVLDRMQRCEIESVRHHIARMHGYQILGSALWTWKEDLDVVAQILDVLDKFPRLTRNKIVDSKIEEPVGSLTDCDDERVREAAKALLEVWSTLEVGYRIPRKRPQQNPTDQPAEQHEPVGAQEMSRSRSATSSNQSSGVPSPYRPRPVGEASDAGRFYAAREPFHRKRFPRPTPLPAGWFLSSIHGRPYYYTKHKQSQWDRPTEPAYVPPPPMKAKEKEQMLQAIIDRIVNEEPKPKEAPPASPPAQHLVEEPVVRPRKDPQDKYKKLPEDKKKKLYEITLFPHVRHVIDKFKSKLPKDDLKRLGKEVAQKLVNSDFKNKRVEDPTVISVKQEKVIKQYVAEFLGKAVAKKRERDAKRAARKETNPDAKESPTEAKDAAAGGQADDDQLMDMLSPDRAMTNGSTLKRKRDGDDGDASISPDDDDDNAGKRIKPEMHAAHDPPLKREREGDDPDDYFPGDDYDGHINERAKSESPPPTPPPPPPDFPV